MTKPVSYPLYEYGGSGKTVIHLAHANGFPPQVYTEMLSSFLADYRVVTLPARPLWQPAPPPEAFTGWEMMADDLIAGIEAHGLAPVYGIGHSMGGTATLIAASKRPDLFKALVLLDPVLFPRSFTFWLLAAGPSWLPKPESPLVKKTLRRRRHWENQQEAFERFYGRSIFENWSETAVRDYIEGLTHASPSGGIELRYTPEWEARIYETAPRSTYQWWKWLKKLTVPTLALQGAKTDTFVAASVNLWQNTRPDLPIISLANQGHLFPISSPQLSAEHIMQYLKQQEAKSGS